MADVVVHPEPAWRDHADFIIAGQIPDSGPGNPKQEQLWARQVGDFEFEICCIPFFLYDIALGDKVVTGECGDDKYLLSSVIEGSGRYVFRAWLKTTEIRNNLAEALSEIGCLLETRGPASRLLAIDAANHELAQRVANLLQAREQQGELHYETGRLTT